MKKRVLVVLAAALCITMIGPGCSANWIAQAREIVAVLIPAASNLVTLVAALQGKSVSAADLSTVQNAGAEVGADLQLVQALIAAYESADGTAKPGILIQIQSGVGSAQQNLQGLMLGLHIKDAATQGKIVAIVGLLQAEVQSLAALVPLVREEGTGDQIQGLALRRAQVRTKNLSADEFVKSYNSVLNTKSGNAELDRVSAGLQIHLHSKVERVVSGGVLK